MTKKQNTCIILTFNGAFFSHSSLVRLPSSISSLFSLNSLFASLLLSSWIFASFVSFFFFCLILTATATTFISFFLKNYLWNWFRTAKRPSTKAGFVRVELLNNLPPIGVQAVSETIISLKKQKQKPFYYFMAINAITWGYQHN